MDRESVARSKNERDFFFVFFFLEFVDNGFLDGSLMLIIYFYKNVMLFVVKRITWTDLAIFFIDEGKEKF